MKPAKVWTSTYQNWEEVTYPAHMFFFHTWTIMVIKLENTANINWCWTVFESCY